MDSVVVEAPPSPNAPTAQRNREAIMDEVWAVLKLPGHAAFPLASPRQREDHRGEIALTDPGRAGPRIRTCEPCDAPISGGLPYLARAHNPNQEERDMVASSVQPLSATSVEVVLMGTRSRLLRKARALPELTLRAVEELESWQSGEEASVHLGWPDPGQPHRAAPREGQQSISVSSRHDRIALAPQVDAIAFGWIEP